MKESEWFQVPFVLSEIALASSISLGKHQNSYIELPGSMLPHVGADESDHVTLHFKTSSPDGLLFWQGQKQPGGKSKDYLSLALQEGALILRYDSIYVFFGMVSSIHEKIWKFLKIFCDFLKFFQKKFFLNFQIFRIFLVFFKNTEKCSQFLFFIY